MPSIIAFNMGGMGPNHCDIQSMVLLPELLYRHAFGHSLLTVPPAWTATPNRLPILEEHDSWDTARVSWVPEPPREPEAAAAAGTLSAIAHRLPEPVKGLLKVARSAAADWRSHHAPPERRDFDYMPSYRYRHHWPRMPAFALPSFLDGRIRINLRGRERHGIVELSQYEETCRTLETLLGECRDPRTGEPAVATIERASTANPLALASSESDLLVVWRDVVAALEHPRLGLIGPVPLRRTGGHTRHGIAYLAAPGLEPGERGVRSSFDVVPTIVQLLGAKPAHPPNREEFALRACLSRPGLGSPAREKQSVGYLTADFIDMRLLRDKLKSQATNEGLGSGDIETPAISQCPGNALTGNWRVSGPL